MAGRVALEAHPQRPESVLVTNVSTAPVGLDGYALAIPGSMFPFPDHTVLAPGERLRYPITGDRYRLPDPGGAVRLRTFTAIAVACDAWGSGSCDG